MKFAWLCSHESYQPELLVEQAVQAEAAGFDMVLPSDHFHPWVDDTSAAGFAWSWLGAAAARTSHVELGTSVTCPLFHYHPALIAQAAATVDRLSGGRFTLGLGTGEAINETPLGWSFPGYSERMARMREALIIIRRLLDGEKLDFDGEYYRTATARLYSPPVHRIPVLVAAGGTTTARFAGETADGLITSVKDPGETNAKVIGPFQDARADGSSASAGTILATRWTVLAKNDEEAWTRCRPCAACVLPGDLR
ncbi:MAG: TIGR03557 family F420-dependent LLM class oxidoreductase [Streptosporangiaceae bacterium]